MIPRRCLEYHMMSRVRQLTLVWTKKKKERKKESPRIGTRRGGLDYITGPKRVVCAAVAVALAHATRIMCEYGILVGEVQGGRTLYITHISMALFKTTLGFDRRHGHSRLSINVLLLFFEECRIALLLGPIFKIVLRPTPTSPHDLHTFS